MAANPNVRVVVRLPWDRPDNPLPDPPKIEWNQEKADILWRVIEKSRSSDSAGPDWKGLAAHLQVPLPYLLYRVNARFQEDIRGLRDLQGALSTRDTHSLSTEAQQWPSKPSPIDRSTSQQAGSSRLIGSGKFSNPLDVRARLNSIGNRSNALRPTISSSTLTIQGNGTQRGRTFEPMRPTSPSSSEGTDSDEELTRKEEDAERDAEEQETLERKLQQLQSLITSDALGLVRSGIPRSNYKGKEPLRGRTETSSPHSMASSYRQDALSGSVSRSTSQSTSQSVSSTSSPQGSIPDIPSPPPELSPHQARLQRRFSVGKSTSPPTLSPRSALGQRYRPLMDRAAASERSSSHGSETSSFSDLSDASLSASALESALMSNMSNMSNIRGTSSRGSQFGRSRTINRNN